MALSSAELTTFDKLGFPKTVYKYREAKNDQHRTTLTKQIVYFAAPKTFKDKSDCKIPTRYDLLTDDEIFDSYVKLFKEIHPEWDIFYLRQQATVWSNKGLLRDTNLRDKRDLYHYNELNERYGVLSLTDEPANIKMWKKYSKNFNGFCIGFNPIIMFKFLGGGGAVRYYKKLPIIKPSDSIDSKIRTLAFSKLKKWEFEKEYRTQKFWPHPIGNESRKTIIPNSAFTEIILGHNTNLKTQKEIIKQAKCVNPVIDIKITTLENRRVIIKPYV